MLSYLIVVAIGIVILVALYYLLDRKFLTSNERNQPMSLKFTKKFPYVAKVTEVQETAVEKSRRIASEALSAFYSAVEGLRQAGELSQAAADEAKVEAQYHLEASQRALQEATINEQFAADQEARAVRIADLIGDPLV